MLSISHVRPLVATLGFAVGLLLVGTACGPKSAGNQPAADHRHDHDEGHDHGHTHGHAPQHDGHLVEIGNHVAMLEFKLDAATGTLTMWVLDGHAENHVRLTQETLTLAITPANATEPITVRLLAQAKPETTGETVGDTSEFRGQSDALKNVERFTATIEKISVRGNEFADVKFPYPEGRMHQYENAE